MESAGLGTRHRVLAPSSAPEATTSVARNCRSIAPSRPRSQSALGRLLPGDIAGQRPCGTQSTCATDCVTGAQHTDVVAPLFACAESTLASSPRAAQPRHSSRPGCVCTARKAASQPSVPLARVHTAMAATGRVASFSRARFDSVTDDTRSEGSGADIGEDGAPGPETTPIMDLESGVRGQSSFHTATTHGTVGAHASARGAEHKAGTGVGGSAGAGAGVPEATAGAHVCAHKAQDSNHPRGARQPREGRFATSGVLSHSASGIVVSKAGGQSFRTSCSGCSASDANPQQARARTRAHTHTPPVLRSSAVLMAKAEQSVHDRCGAVALVVPQRPRPHARALPPPRAPPHPRHYHRHTCSHAIGLRHGFMHGRVRVGGLV